MSQRWTIVLNSGLGNNVIIGPVLGGLEDALPGLRYDLVATSTGIEEVRRELDLQGLVGVLPAMWRRFGPADQPELLAHLEANGVEVLLNLRLQVKDADGDYLRFRRRAVARGIACWDLHEIGDDEGDVVEFTTMVDRLLEAHAVCRPALTERWLARHRAAGPRGTVGAFVGASVGVKRWTVRRWSETVHALSETIGLKIELAAGPGDTERRLLAQCRRRR